MSNTQMKIPDDSFYIDSVLNGDNSAFARLVDKHKDMVFSIILKIVHSREDAEEVAQDVFLKAFRSLGSFERKSRFSTWLFRIAYNAAITRSRRKKYEFIPLDDRLMANYSEDEIRLSAGQMDSEDRKMLIESALNKLPGEDNLLITLFYKTGNSVEEISDITGLTESNVKVRLHRIRKRLYNEISLIMKYQVAV